MNSEYISVADDCSSSRVDTMQATLEPVEKAHIKVGQSIPSIKNTQSIWRTPITVNSSLLNKIVFGLATVLSIQLLHLAKLDVVVGDILTCIAACTLVKTVER